MTKRRLACFTFAAALAASAMPAAPALADGAASTRNIIIGGAAATLLIINHNRKVHEKYAEKTGRSRANRPARAMRSPRTIQRSRRTRTRRRWSRGTGTKSRCSTRKCSACAIEIAMSRRTPQHVAAAQPQPSFHPLVAAATYHPDRNATRIASNSSGWGAL